jgi:hypothetical protein
MSDVQETLFDSDLFGRRGSPKNQYISPHPTPFKMGVPHREKVFVGIRAVMRRKENKFQ